MHRSRNFRSALEKLRAVREGKQSHLDSVEENDKDIVTEVDDEEFVNLKNLRSVKGFIEKDIEDDEIDEDFDNDEDGGEISLPNYESRYVEQLRGSDGEEHKTPEQKTRETSRKRGREKCELDMFGSRGQEGPRKRRSSGMKLPQGKSVMDLLKPKTAVNVDDDELLVAMEAELAENNKPADNLPSKLPGLHLSTLEIDWGSEFAALGRPAKSLPVLKPKNMPEVPGSDAIRSDEIQSAESPIMDPSLGEDPIETPDAPTKAAPSPDDDLPEKVQGGSSQRGSSQVDDAPYEACSDPSNTSEEVVGIENDIIFGDFVGMHYAPQAMARAAESGQPRVDNASNTELSNFLVRSGEEGMREDFADGGILFFLVDTYEPSLMDGKAFGGILLFGKVYHAEERQLLSGCLVVSDVSRNIFLRPKRQPSDVLDEKECKRIMTDMAEDLRQVCSNIDAPQIRVKPRRRRAALYYQKKQGENGELQLNQDELYLKFSVPGSTKNLSIKTFDCAAITHVFGLDRSLVETFLVKRQIMGPSWLFVKGAGRADPTQKRSNLDLELLVDSYKMITPASDNLIRLHKLPATPPLTVISMSLQSIRTTLKKQTAVREKDDSGLSIVVLNLVAKVDCDVSKLSAKPLVEKNFKRSSCLYLNEKTTLPTKSFEKTYHLVTRSVKELVKLIIEVFSVSHPDLILSHDFYGNSCPTLISLISSSNNVDWSRISRIKRAPASLPFRWHRMPVYDQSRLMFGGILVCDLLKQAQEIAGSRTSYALPDLLEDYYPPKPATQSWQRRLLSIEQIRDALELASFQDSERFPSLSVVIKGLEGEFKQDMPGRESTILRKLNTLCQGAGYLEACMNLHLADALNTLPLNQELAQITGSLWNRSLFCQRAERNEFLLLHTFRKWKWLLPDKLSLGVLSQNDQSYGFGDSLDPQDESQHEKDHDETVPEMGKQVDSITQTSKKGPAYKGGLVLDPVAGYYDSYILYLDFASLYPSIIQEFDLCFSTLVRDNKVVAIDVKTFKRNLEKPMGLLPTLLKNLVEKRSSVKSMMKKAVPDSAEYATLDVKQRAVKLVANSIYGSLGYKYFRFYSPFIASTVTALGRHVLLMTKDRVENNFGCKVIYGDTDSIMIDSGLRDFRKQTTAYYEALEKAHMIAKEVSKHHERLELEVETVFKKLLLLTKKKYAALKVTDAVKKVYTKDLKGLDIVRRDWCDLTKKVGNSILDILFEENAECDPDQTATRICEKLSDLRSEMGSGSIPLQDFVITKCLTKLPSAYANPQQHPHVIIALEMLKGGAQVHQGLNIPYIICNEGRRQNGNEDKFSATLAFRAYHPKDIDVHGQREGGLTVDVDWYKNNQVLPPVQRLCHSIPSLSGQRLAEALGCAWKSIKTKSDNQTGCNEWVPSDDSLAHSVEWTSSIEKLTSAAQYGNSSISLLPVHLQVPCPYCESLSDLESLMDATGTCSTCGRKVPLKRICDFTISAVNDLISQYHRYKMRCRNCNTEAHFTLSCECGGADLIFLTTTEGLQSHIQWAIDKLQRFTLNSKLEWTCLLEIIEHSDLSEDRNVQKEVYLIRDEQNYLFKTLTWLGGIFEAPKVNLLSLLSNLGITAKSQKGQWVE